MQADFCYIEKFERATFHEDDLKNGHAKVCGCKRFILKQMDAAYDRMISQEEPGAVKALESIP